MRKSDIRVVTIDDIEILYSQRILTAQIERVQHNYNTKIQN